MSPPPHSPRGQPNGLATTRWRNLGVALSGGGHRAALFSLGALIYLRDAGINTKVRSISSVSGGSWTNAVVGLSCDYREVSRDEFDDVARRLLGKLLRSQPAWVFWAGLVAVLALLEFLSVNVLSEIVAQWLHPGSDPLGRWERGLLSTLIELILAGCLTAALRRWRHHSHARNLLDLLPGSRLRPPRVSDLRTGINPKARIDHVICATDLEAGDAVRGRHIYFSGAEIRSSAYDVGLTEGMPLRKAVAASMAFPVVFAPVRIRPKRLLFNQPPRHGRIKLGDGGIHDNLGLPWMRAATGDRTRNIDCILAINSTWSPLTKRSHRWLPFRSIQVMHQSNVAARVEGAKEWFHRGLTGVGTEPVGAVISIGDSVHDILDPLEEVDGRSNDLDLELARNAVHLRRVLEQKRWSHGKRWPLKPGDQDQTNWSRLAEDAKGLATTIFRVDRQQAARVLFHGYVMTMVNTSVYTGRTPPALSEIRSLDDFRHLVSRKPAEPHITLDPESAGSVEDRKPSGAQSQTRRRTLSLESAFRPTPFDVVRRLIPGSR